MVCICFILTRKKVKVKKEKKRKKAFFLFKKIKLETKVIRSLQRVVSSFAQVYLEQNKHSGGSSLR